MRRKYVEGKSEEFKKHLFRVPIITHFETLREILKTPSPDTIETPESGRCNTKGAPTKNENEMAHPIAPKFVISKSKYSYTSQYLAARVRALAELRVVRVRARRLLSREKRDISRRPIGGIL